ncbi:NAD-dependent epimerase/dehydratase family protein [Pseudoalteromonas rubra]|uniref:UDP-glucose 4-epimerase n=1 Tax=Pseudoalteromonas rubra TaxID=43658 RepID=A0A5S3WYI9_9GAMM|nr:NAD-dependent epimerase/dehydratase family protein [Pseudoalteromonas rubra]TMP36652.1 UDP-glucose 4-epimerase [Pseudoalteromonas rubra]
MSKVILSGSTGFIGKHLNKYLEGNGCSTYAISREELSASEVPFDGFFSSEQHADADAVVHLVGAAHRSFTDSEANFINLELTKKVLDRAIELGIPRFIFLSSVNIYSESDDIISLDTPIELSALPNTMKSKLSAEAYIKNAAIEHEIEVVIIRSPLVYGEGVQANFATLMRLVGKGIPLPFGAINQNRRSLVSVYNLIDLLNVCIEHPKAKNQTFFVSDDRDLSTSAMVAMMAEVQGKTNWSFFVPVFCLKLLGKLLGKQDVIERLTGSLQVDITHTKNTLDWQPPYSPEHGFRLAAKK